MTTMKTVTIKVWFDTRKLLRLIAAMTSENLMEVVHRLATAEWERLNNGDRNDKPV